MSDKKTVKKEVGADGLPIQRLGSYLVADLHHTFTLAVDDLLLQGWIDEAEYVTLSTALKASMDSFREAIPAALTQRPFGHSAHMLAEEAQMAEEEAEAVVAPVVIELGPIDANLSGPPISPQATIMGISNYSKEGVSEAVTRWASDFVSKVKSALTPTASPVVVDEPVESGGSVKFFQDKQGDYWILAIYSNHWKDLQGDIISEAAHTEYALWIAQTGFEPAVTLAHLPHLSEKFWNNAFDRFSNDIPAFNALIGEVYKDFGFARVKRVIPMNGFVVALAKVNSDKRDVARKLAAMPDLGMSHGCLAFDESMDFNLGRTPVTIIDRYRSFEVTVLPRARAANSVTLPIFVEAREMAKSINDADRALLTAVLPAELVDNVDEITATLEKELNERLAFKDLPEDSKPEVAAEPEVVAAEPEVIAEPEVVAEAEAVIEIVAEAETAAVVVDEVMKALNVEGLKAALFALDEKLTDLTAQVAELNALKLQVKEIAKTDDERIAAVISAPPKPGIDWGIAASRSADNVVVVEKSQAVGDSRMNPNGAVPMDMNNPLNALLWSKVTNS